MKPSRGFSLIETLVSLLILSSVLVTGTAMTTRLSNAVRVTSELETHSLQELLLRQALRRGLRGMDSHRLPLFPIVHQQGDMKFGDGTPFRGLRIARRDSDALSYLIADMAGILRVETCTLLSGVPQDSACLIGEPTYSFAEIRNFIVVSPEGVSIHPGRVRGRGVCRLAYLHPSRSLFTSQGPRSLSCSHRLLIPVRTIETLYQDESGQFRIAQHRGEHVIEDQPFLTADLRVTYSLQLHEASGTVMLTAFYAREGRPPRQLSLYHSLGRRHEFDLLLNL